VTALGNGLFIAGTDKGVGKTLVASVLAPAVHRRIGNGGDAKIMLWKPVQIGVTGPSPHSDSARLVFGSGLPLEPPDTFTYAFPEPVLPWMAAQREGARISFAQLVEDGLERLRTNDFTFVEGVGGLAVPLTDRHLMSDLAGALDLPLLIVARPGIGTVNHTLLTVSFARQAGLRPVGILFNGYREAQQQLMEENAIVIERFTGVPVVGRLPWMPGSPVTPKEWDLWRERWLAIVESQVEFERFLPVGA